jgi:hypothetical protein
MINNSISDIQFNKVISMVENGWTIQKALIKLNIHRSVFYKNLSKEQKCLLNIAKASNTEYGASGYHNFNMKIFMNKYNENDSDDDI